MNHALVIILLLTLSSCSGQANRKNWQQAREAGNLVVQEATGQNIRQNQPINQVVRTVFQNSQGQLWFGTESGAFQLSGQSLIHIDEIKSASGQGVTIKAIAEDRNGTLWLGHTDGVSSVKGAQVTNYYTSDGLVSNDVWSIEASRDGKIWIGTIDGVSVFDGQSFSRFDLPEGQIDSTRGVSSTRMVHHIMEDSKGTLWLCTNAGLFAYANNRLEHVSKVLGMPTTFVNEILEDTGGALWISTKTGLYTLQDSELTNITQDVMEIGKGIGTMAEDSNGLIWFVANQHDLYTWDGEAIRPYPKAAHQQGPVVFDIFEDQSDRLWFVGFGGAYRLEADKWVHITSNGPW